MSCGFEVCSKRIALYRPAVIFANVHDVPFRIYYNLGQSPGESFGVDLLEPADERTTCIVIRRGPRHASTSLGWLAWELLLFPGGTRNALAKALHQRCDKEASAAVIGPYQLMQDTVCT
jgi:hypothetical protein